MLFEKIDSFLIDLIESQSHQFQRLTGKDCFWLAELFLYTFIAIWISYGEYQILVGHANISLFIIGGLSVFVLTIANFLLLEITKRKFWKNPKFKNNERLNIISWGVRICWIFITLICLTGLVLGTKNSLYDYTYTISALSIVLFFYLISCTPLPPGTSMLRKLLSKVREALTLSPQPIADPTPS